MFKNIFKRKDKILKSIFLAGEYIPFSGDQQFENYIATQITSKENVEVLYYGLELVYENGKLIKAYDYSEGNRTLLQLKSDELGIEYKEFEVNRILQLVEDKNGQHQLGGEIPNDFVLPDHNCIVEFQYLGFINNKDPNFNWLPFKIHLTCPIYLNVSNIFLDYTNPNKPLLINRKEAEKSFTSFGDDINRNSEIVFNEKNFSFVEVIGFPETGHAGVPKWEQWPEIPICPKSGIRMKFLCQLNGGVTTKRTNIEINPEWYENPFEVLDFWGDGVLIVFFEPTSKVACYIIQNS